MIEVNEMKLIDFFSSLGKKTKESKKELDKGITLFLRELIGMETYEEENIEKFIRTRERRRVFVGLVYTHIR